MMWTHVSELAIDRLLGGELSPGDAAALRDHATRCNSCGDLLDDALAAQAEFAVARPPLGLPVPLRRRRGVAIGAIATAMAAAVAVAIVWPRAPANDEVRTKGTSIVGFFVSHDEAVRRGAQHETVMPGDRVELYTTTFEPVWFTAFGDDATGTRSVYVEPRQIDPAREQIVPLSIELDGTLGSEVVTGVFCTMRIHPLAVIADAPPRGCTVDRFTLVKVPR